MKTLPFQNGRPMNILGKNGALEEIFKDHTAGEESV